MTSTGHIDPDVNDEVYIVASYVMILLYNNAICIIMCRKCHNFNIVLDASDQME